MQRAGTFGGAWFAFAIVLGGMPLAAAESQALSPADGLYSSLDSPPVLKVIAKARKTLDIEIYTMKHPKVIEALRDALKRKVRVRIIKDPAPVNDDCPLFPQELAAAQGQPKDPDSCANQRKLVKEVNAQSARGSLYVPFVRAELCKNADYYCFQHGKLVIADGEVALLSSGNFDPTNLCTEKGQERCNRDYTYVMRDPKLVASLQTLFEKDLGGKRYDLLGMIKRGEVDPRLVVSPYSEIPLLRFIESAKTEIRLQNQYLKQQPINDALIAAAKRGVKVKLNVSSFCSFGKPSARELAQIKKTYEAFDATGGIETRMFTGKQKIKGTRGYLHAKAILVDGKRAWVGSVNGSMTSVINNREYGLFFEDAESVRLLSVFLKHDFEDSRSETWRESTACAKDPLP